MSTNRLTATYKAPGAFQTFAANLPSNPEAGNVKAKTAYLSSLRADIVQMQSDVNAFLTMKMDEGRAVEAEKASASKTKEAQEEDMYGEDLEIDG